MVSVVVAEKSVTVPLCSIVVAAPNASPGLLNFNVRIFDTISYFISPSPVETRSETSPWRTPAIGLTVADTKLKLLGRAGSENVTLLKLEVVVLGATKLPRYI